VPTEEKYQDIQVQLDVSPLLKDTWHEKMVFHCDLLSKLCDYLIFAFIK
jgi:hypothetical protein